MHLAAALPLLGLVLAAPEAAESGPQLTRAPELLELVQADYPPSALERGVEGPVELWLDLDATGAVTYAEVVSAPEVGLAEAALVAAVRLRFSPAEVDGVPAPVRVAYTYRFVLPAITVPPKPPVLTGLVLDATGGPAGRALVEVEPGGLWGEAGLDGAFRLDLPQAGAFRVRISAVGSKVLELPITAAADEEVSLEVQLEPDALGAAAFETVVRARAPIFEVSRRQLSRAELRSVPGAFGDPLRVLESLPGVGRSPFANGILVMRGSSPDDSGVYVDGHRMPLLYHFGGGPSVIPPESIGKIDVQPGAFGVRYGRATAGVVEVDTAPGRFDDYHGGAHVAVLDAGGTVEGPIESIGSFRLAARRSYLETLLPLVDDAGVQGDSLNLVPRYYDYLGRADLLLSKRLRLVLAAHGSDDGLTYANDRGPANLPSQLDLQIKAHRVSPRLIADLEGGYELTVAPTVAWLKTGGETPYSFLELETEQRGLRAELVRRHGEGDHVLLGVDMVQDHYDFVARLPQVPAAREFPSPNPSEPLTSDVYGQLRVRQLGVYLEANTHRGIWRLIPGLRLETARFNGRSETFFEPRVAMRGQLLPDIAIKAAVGLYHRLPDPNQISPRTGNPTLEAERSLQGTAGFEWQALDNLDVDMQLYTKSMMSLTQASSTVRLVRNRLETERFVNDGEGRVMGAEVMVRRQLRDGIMGWVAYSLSRSERRRDKRDWELYVRDQTHNLSLVMSVDLPWEIRLGGRLRFVTGYPVTPIVDAEFDADTARYIPRSGDGGPIVRLPDFAQLDVRVQKLFGEADGAHLLLFIDVQNVTNRLNAEYFEYSYDFSERYAFPSLPILPSLGVEARF